MRGWDPFKYCNGNRGSFLVRSSLIFQSGYLKDQPRKLGQNAHVFISEFGEDPSMLWSGWGALSKNITGQDMGTHLASIKAVSQPPRRNVRWVMLARWRWTQEKGQTYVFISIILHNNTGFYFFLFFLWPGTIKEKTDVIKGHPVAGIHIWRNVYL